MHCIIENDFPISYELRIKSSQKFEVFLLCNTHTQYETITFKMIYFILFKFQKFVTLDKNVVNFKWKKYINTDPDKQRKYMFELKYIDTY